MKKLFVSVLSLVMTMSFTAVSFAAGENTGTATMPNETEKPYSQDIDVYGDLTLENVDLVKDKTLAAEISWVIDDLGIAVNELAEYKWDTEKLCYVKDTDVDIVTELIDEGTTEGDVAITVKNIGDCNVETTVEFSDETSDTLEITETPDDFDGAIETVAKKNDVREGYEGYYCEVGEGGKASPEGGANSVTYTAKLKCTSIDTTKEPATGHLTVGHYTVVISEKATETFKKGDLVKLDNKEAVYRVISVNGDNLEVLSMTGETKAFNNPSKTTTMGEKNVQQYENSDLDKYLNGTYYDNLSTKTKAAIVPQNITQYAYGFESKKPESGDYWTGTKFDSSEYYISRPGLNKTVGERNVYALDISDVIEYLGAENLTAANVNKLFFDRETAGSNYCWLRSANTNMDANAFIVFANFGSINCSFSTGTSEVRAAFVIDKTAVKVTKVTG